MILQDFGWHHQNGDCLEHPNITSPLRGSVKMTGPRLSRLLSIQQSLSLGEAAEDWNLESLICATVI